jgi:hypothetical protein
MHVNLVSARQGALWVREGFRTFFKQPLAFTGLFFLYLFVMGLATLVPLVGPFLPLLLVPAATLGFMAAAADAQKGKFPLPTVLIAAFRVGRERLNAMLVLGGLYALAVCLLFALTSLADGGRLARLALVGGRITQDLVDDDGFQTAALLAAVLYAPVSMLFWHAPALVHWHGVGPVKSLFFSMVACMRNFWAMTVYAIGWMVVFASAMIGTVLAAGLLGNTAVAGVALVPLMLFMASVFFASFYATFRDSFIVGAHPPSLDSSNPQTPPHE